MGVTLLITIKNISAKTCGTSSQFALEKHQIQILEKCM